MFDKKTLLRNFKRAAKKEEKRTRWAALEFNIKPVDVKSWSESVKPRNCKHENLIGNAPFITCKDCGKAMDEKPHYKWNWKLGKAVRV